MKKRILSSILIAVLFLSTLSLFSCGASKLPEEGTVTRMTVEVNPSVEFMVDDENKVISVTALNDDGSVLIVGESFVGMTPEEATERFVTLAAETGFLISGNVSDGENTVKISVSGDSAYAKELSKQIGKKAEAVLDAYGVKGKVEKAEEMAHEELLALALETGLYTEEELAEMTDAELCRVISAGRIETALLLTEDMREAYYRAKEYEISFTEREETARIIEAMGGLQTLTYTAYKAALDLYAKAIKAIDEFRYNTLVSPDSEYQKSLRELRESKTEYLKQKNYTATLEVNGEEYAAASAELELTEEEYEKALAAYEAFGVKANEALEALVAAMREAETALISLEEHFSADVKSELSEKASEIEASVNAAKDGFFAEFESAHKADIESAQADLLQRKQALLDAVGKNGES